MAEPWSEPVPAAVDDPARDPSHGPATRSAALVALLAFAVYATFSLVRYRIGQAGWDLAIFDQAVNHYAHLRPPYAPVRGPGVNVLGVEPSMSRDGGRAEALLDGELRWLAPGESRRYATTVRLAATA